MTIKDDRSRVTAIISSPDASIRTTARIKRVGTDPTTDPIEQLRVGLINQDFHLSITEVELTDLLDLNTDELNGVIASLNLTFEADEPTDDNYRRAAILLDRPAPRARNPYTRLSETMATRRDQFVEFAGSLKWLNNAMKVVSGFAFLAWILWPKNLDKSGWRTVFMFVLLTILLYFIVKMVQGYALVKVGQTNQLKWCILWSFAVSVSAIMLVALASNGHNWAIPLWAFPVGLTYFAVLIFREPKLVTQEPEEAH